MAALSAGHFATDFANGALPALLPFFVDRFGLSYTLAAAVMLACGGLVALVQPLFGAWSDRRGAIWLLPGGVALAGSGSGSRPRRPRYWLVLLRGRLGARRRRVPPRGVEVRRLRERDKRASGMSLFSIGGNVGYALGPTVTTPLVLALGLTGGLLLALPVLAIAGALLLALPFLSGFAPDPGERPAASGKDRPGALVLLLGVIAFRSVAWFGLSPSCRSGRSRSATRRRTARTCSR